METKRTDIEHANAVSVDYVQADLSDAEAIVLMMSDIHKRHGGVDILVNNAVTRHFSPTETFPVDMWDRALAVNVSAAFHTIRLSLSSMRARNWGRIFNMTSVYAERAVANRIDYVTSKAALVGMTRVIALETLNQGITCNAICPGAVLTPTSDMRIRALMDESGFSRELATQHFLAGKQPTHRFIDPHHVAALFVFLCGPAGGDITGATLPVEGGWLSS